MALLQVGVVQPEQRGVFLTSPCLRELAKGLQETLLVGRQAGAGPFPKAGKALVASVAKVGRQEGIQFLSGKKKLREI